MKTLLIRLNNGAHQLPMPDAPLGLMYLAASLEQAGHDVIIRDLNIDCIDDDVYDDIVSGEIGLVGISMLSYLRSEAYLLVKKFKELNPNVKIIVGGIFASAFPEMLTSRFDIDACVIGEGEQTIVEIADAVQAGQSFKDIKGVYCAEHGWQGERPLIKNLDDIPFPAWKHSNLDAFPQTITTIKKTLHINGVTIGGKRCSTLIASRGCVGRCVFCNAFKHWGNCVRFRSSSNILDEIETLHHEYGVDVFQFNDDAFPLNRKQAVEFCEGVIARGLKIAWHTTTRGDVLDSELCKLMFKSGCFMCAVGIESGSQTIQNGLKKNLSLDKARRTIGFLNDAGIISYALLMVGNRGETEQTINETIAWLNEAKPRYYSYVTGVMLVPDTELYNHAKSVGAIDDEYFLRPDTDGLPYYLHENDMQTLQGFASKIEREVPKNL